MLDPKITPECIEGITADDIPANIIQSAVPIKIKNLVNNWPIVQAGLKSKQHVANYLKGFYNGRSTIVCKIAPEQNGRMFYNQNFTQLDYQSYMGKIDETLDQLIQFEHNTNSPGLYIASNIIESHFPDLTRHNVLNIPRNSSDTIDSETISIWIGNATTATCHYDALNNIACNVAGHRKFTLFPPDQVHNLYPGPLEPTPGGQAISLVDFKNPNFEHHPRFKVALENALIFELEPGDALFIPSMWWHHVEALCPLNILINYWWQDAPRYLTSGMNAIYMAMLAIRDKPKHERNAWKHLFDYYIFDGAKNSNQMLPFEAQGFLAELDESLARRLRAMLLNKLNR